MAHWDMCNASGPSQTCVRPECFCRLALSDCHSQVPLESRHVLTRVPFTFLEIVGSAMSPDPTASSSCPPPPRQRPGPQTRDGKSMPERVSLWLVPTPELDIARYRVGSGMEDHRLCRACLAPGPWPYIKPCCIFSLTGASQYCDSASPYRVPSQPSLKLRPGASTQQVPVGRKPRIFRHPTAVPDPASGRAIRNLVSKYGRWYKGRSCCGVAVTNARGERFQEFWSLDPNPLRSDSRLASSRHLLCTP